MARLDLAAGDALGNFFRIDLELIRRDLFFDLFYFVGAFARARQLSDPFLIMCQTGGAFLGHHQSTRLTWMLFGNFAVFLNCRVGFAPRMMNKIQIRVDPGGGMLQGPRHVSAISAFSSLNDLNGAKRWNDWNVLNVWNGPIPMMNGRTLRDLERARSAGTVGTDGTVYLR
jgi:hypothetical protein